MAFLLCLFSVLCFALCAAENREIVETFEGLQPQQDSLLPFNKLHDSLESVNRQNLMDLIHKLSKYENGIFRQEFRETEKQKRGAKSGLTTQRPCRVFYWKSWASC